MERVATEAHQVPRAAFSFLRVFLGVMWIYEAWRGAEWAIPAAVIGILLLLGIATPIVALVGAVISAVVLTQAGPITAWGPWTWLHWLVILMHLLVMFTRAGRVLGIDNYLARWRPEWPIW